MSEKNNFFPIGETSKLTGASIYSLRYYERIKLLEPAYIDTFSGYRYYSLDQIYLIGIISLCIELDIPLKKLTQFMGKDGTVDFSGLIAYGKEIAEKKLKTLQKGLKFINDVEQKIAETEKYALGKKVYSRKIPKKYFYVTPCKKSPKNEDLIGVIKDSLSSYYYNDNYDKWIYSGLLEYGFLCEFSSAPPKYYTFSELPENMAVKIKENIMLIPEGTYMCRQSNESAIENAPQIFSKHLKGKDSFLAIETDIFTGSYKIHNPLSELRVIVR